MGRSFNVSAKRPALMRVLLPAVLLITSCSTTPEEPESARNNSGLIFHKVPPKPARPDYSTPATPTPTPGTREVHPANDFRDSPFSLNR